MAAAKGEVLLSWTRSRAYGNDSGAIRLLIAVGQCHERSYLGFGTTKLPLKLSVLETFQALPDATKLAGPRTLRDEDQQPYSAVVQRQAKM